MSSPLTPDFESRYAAPHASNAKHRRCASVPVLGATGVQHVIQKFEKSGNRRVSPYTSRGSVMSAHAVPGPHAKGPSTPPRRSGNRLSSPRAARTGHSASSPQAAGTAAIVGRSLSPRTPRDRTPNQQSPQAGAGTLQTSSPFSLGVPDAPSTVL